MATTTETKTEAKPEAKPETKEVEENSDQPLKCKVPIISHSFRKHAHI